MRWKRENEYLLVIEPGIRVYLTPEIEKTLDETAVRQLVNASRLPGVCRVLALPDVHAGYGLPVGGVMATRVAGGVISPGAVGVDINCGVRLLATNLTASAVAEINTRQKLLAAFRREIPAGKGREGVLSLSKRDFHRLLHNGPGLLVERGWGEKRDVQVTEEEGTLPGAEPARIPAELLEYGRKQLGSLGSGNHFVELQVVEEVFSVEPAKLFRLFPGQVVVMVHSGSRRMGNGTALHFVKKVCRPAMKKYGIELSHQDLACVPWGTPEAESYWGAMAACANYAWANRQVLMEKVRRVLREVLSGTLETWTVYDVAHNIAKIEEFGEEKLIVHRKGATRALPAGDRRVPLEYRQAGQPALIPGSMGTRSWVVIGTPGVRQTLNSVNHGAGRVMSRKKALGGKKNAGLITREEFYAATEGKGIMVASGTGSDLRDEAPGAYKDSDEVLRTMVLAGLVRPVAALKPLVVLKG